MTREELLSQAFKDESGTLWIPVDTSNLDLIDLLRSGDHIVYKCKNCGLELKKYYDVRHKDSTKESLCQSCRMTKCEDRNVPITITDKAQLDNLKYGQKFTYNCVKCGKTCTYDFRPQRKNLYSTMMCGECRIHSSRESNWNYNGDKEITLNITDYSDFDEYNIRNGQKIHYVCKGCGADVNVRFSHGEDNKREDGLRRMLCSMCAHKDTYNKMYGGNNMALTIVFDHETKEKALKLRDDLCNALVGIPGFVNNEIIVNTQDIDKETLQPLNEEGNMVVVDKDGEKHEHCVRLIIDGDKQSHEIPNRIMLCKGVV